MYIYIIGINVYLWNLPKAPKERKREIERSK